MWRACSTCLVLVHPPPPPPHQANGLDERFNQTLVNALSKFAQKHRESWDEQLAEVVYAYNTAVQESTKRTPFEVMFGRKENLPIDFNAAATYDPDEKLTEFLQVQYTIKG